MKIKYISYVIYMILSLFLGGCLDDNASGNQGSDTAENVSHQYRLSVTAFSDQNKIATHEAPLSVTASLKKTSGEPVAGVVLQFSARHAHFNITDGQVLTDAQGNATITIYPEEAYQGADYLTVKYLDPTQYESEELASITEIQVAYAIHQTSDESLQATSDDTVLGGGYADQQHFSLSVDTLNPEAWNFDNQEVRVTASLSDRNGNPVPDGTMVYFMAESGQIGSSCQTLNGQCVVKWYSQNEQNRPTDHRATILAYALGNESFYDKDGDGLMSSADGEPWDNKTSSGLKNIFVNQNGQKGRKLITLNRTLDEPFRDENKNGVFDEPYQDSNNNGKFDLGEVFVDYNQNGQHDGALPSGEVNYLDLNGNGHYDGSGLKFAEIFTDLNFNGIYDQGEFFADRSDMYGYTVGQYNNGYITLVDRNGVSQSDFTGLESFTNLDGSTDANGNPTFNLLGFSDLSEPWLDMDENGVRSIDEPFIDFDENGVFTARNGQYDGITCKAEDAICSKKVTYVRRAIALVLASSQPVYKIHYVSGTNIDSATGNCSANDLVATNTGTAATICTLPMIKKGGKINLELVISDTAGQTLPKETDITAVSMLWNRIAGLDHYKVSNNNAEGLLHIPFSISNDPTQSDLQNDYSDTVTINVTTPNKVVTRIPVYVQYSKN